MAQNMQEVERLRVLFICTANVCRSPLAAAVLSHHAHARGAPVAVASAGMMTPGKPAHEHTQAAIAPWGVDLSEKRSREVSPQLIRGSHLVLAMETHHARRAMGEEPPSSGKVFLFQEMASIAQRLGPRLVSAGQTTEEWLRAARSLRSPSYAEDVTNFEIPDPIGDPAPVYVELRDQFDGWCTQLLDALFPTTA